MKQTDDRLKLSQPARYQIQVQGRLDDAWTDHFTGMTLSTQGEGAVTTLEGTAPDQAALFGLSSASCSTCATWDCPCGWLDG
jgi:hypothetical protein